MKNTSFRILMSSIFSIFLHSKLFNSPKFNNFLRQVITMWPWLVDNSVCGQNWPPPYTDMPVSAL